MIGALEMVTIKHNKMGVQALVRCEQGSNNDANNSESYFLNYSPLVGLILPRVKDVYHDVPQEHTNYLN